MARDQYSRGAVIRRRSSARHALIVAVTAVGLGAAFLAQPAAAQVPAGDLVTVREISVEGMRRIDPATVISYTGVEIGDTLTASEVNAVLRRLFETGLFESVELVPEGDTLTITVIENATVNVVAFEGNDLVPDEALSAAIRLQPRRAFNRGDAEADAQAIVDAYRGAGRFNARVEPVIIRQPDNRVDVVFEITEGEVTEVADIVFIGNRVYSDGDLRDVIATRRAGLLSRFLTSDNYNPDRLDLDRELLREFYLNEGFADFEVLSATAELNESRDAFLLTFAVDEGRRYTFGDLGIRSDAAGLTESDFEGVLSIEAGDFFGQDRIEEAIDAIEERAGELGYAFTTVTPRLGRDRDARLIDVTFEIGEGARAFVERIDIVGNSSTLDRVIRREFDLVEGDVFDARELSQTADRLRSLRYFSSVDVTARQGSSRDRAVVRAEVEDQRTGSLSFGVTFTQSEGVGFGVQLAERNFLGRGQQVSADLTLGGDSQATSISFVEPSFLDRDLGVGLRIFDTASETSTATYTQQKTGAEPFVRFPISQNGSLRLSYRISNDELDGGSNVGTVSQYILDEEGTALTSSVSATYTLDRRNSRVAPSAGAITVLGAELAGLGGDTAYLKTTARHRMHTAFRDESIFAFLELEAGAIVSDGDTRVTDRFFLGGTRFRGFAPAGVGPRDVYSATGFDIDDPLGGNYYAIARAQTSFPLGLPEDSGLFGGLFLNVGSVWGLDITDVAAASGRPQFSVDDDLKPRVSGGFSLFYDSPIGPLRLDFATDLLAEDGDDVEGFRLGAGRRF